MTKQMTIVVTGSLRVNRQTGMRNLWSTQFATQHINSTLSEPLDK